MKFRLRLCSCRSGIPEGRRPWPSGHPIHVAHRVWLLEPTSFAPSSASRLESADRDGGGLLPGELSLERRPAARHTASAIVAPPTPAPSPTARRRPPACARRSPSVITVDPADERLPERWARRRGPRVHVEPQASICHAGRRRPRRRSRGIAPGSRLDEGDLGAAARERHPPRRSAGDRFRRRRSRLELRRLAAGAKAEVAHCRNVPGRADRRKLESERAPSSAPQHRPADTRRRKTACRRR